jgi:hypothetical protein
MKTDMMPVATGTQNGNRINPLGHVVIMWAGKAVQILGHGSRHEN